MRRREGTDGGNYGGGADGTVHDGPWSGDIGGYPLTQDNSLRAPSADRDQSTRAAQLNDLAALPLDLLNVLVRKYFDIAYGHDYQTTPNSLPVRNGITVHPGEPRKCGLRWD